MNNNLDGMIVILPPHEFMDSGLGSGPYRSIILRLLGLDHEPFRIDTFDLATKLTKTRMTPIVLDLKTSPQMWGIGEIDRELLPNWGAIQFPAKQIIAIQPVIDLSLKLDDRLRDTTMRAQRDSLQGRIIRPIYFYKPPGFRLLLVVLSENEKPASDNVLFGDEVPVEELNILRYRLLFGELAEDVKRFIVPT